MPACPEALHPLVRPMTPADLDRVMEIELQAYPFPWTRGIFRDCLRVGYDCWCMQLGRETAGYCVLTHAAGESHLLNLCVAPDWQRRGLGEVLLDQALNRSVLAGSREIFLEVRPSNPAARALYLKNGFEQVGQRPDYYSAGDCREDAIIMRKILHEADPAGQG